MMSTMSHQDTSDGMQKNSPTVLDISNFVKEVDRFSRLIEPFALLFYAIDDVRRWRFFKGTVALWLVCNLLCLFLTQGAVFVLASTVVIGIATISLFQVHTHLLSKFLPSSKLCSHSDDEGTIDTVQNFRYSLIEVHDFVVKSNEYLSYFYSVLRWDSIGPSAVYHSEACVFLLCLVVCPARWNCFFFINWFFLCHPHILKRCYKYITESSATSKFEGTAGSGRFEIETTSTKETKSSQNEKEKDNCEMDDQEDDAYDSDLDLTDEVGEKSMIALDPSPNKPGMVARFMEIKKRRKQIASAPAAVKETVVVCCSCHELLVGQSNAQTNQYSEVPEPD